jgi:hypothetical protein
LAEPGQQQVLEKYLLTGQGFWSHPAKIYLEFLKTSQCAMQFKRKIMSSAFWYVFIIGMYTLLNAQRFENCLGFHISNSSLEVKPQSYKKKKRKKN